MMLDTVWTLAHNGGPIFNKGYLYKCYSHTIIRILDVQRSGQIPSAVLSDGPIGHFVQPGLKAHMQQLMARFPDKIASYVDWMVVEALGSVNHYSSEKQLQQQKFGLSPAAKAAQEAAEAKAKEAAEKAAQALIEEQKSNFYVMPGLKVKIIKRAA
jgi:hypothetical protein